jgi:hypothetical protein
MTTEAHLEALKAKHKALEVRLADATAHASSSDQELAEIKHEKLRIKDEIALPRACCRHPTTVKCFCVCGELTHQWFGLLGHGRKGARSSNALKRPLVGWHTAPVRYRVRLKLDMILHGVNIGSDAHRLYRANWRRRKRNGTWRHLLHPHGMPLQGLHAMWKRSEDRIGLAGFREFHVENANLWRTLRTA